MHSSYARCLVAAQPASDIQTDALSSAWLQSLLLQQWLPITKSNPQEFNMPRTGNKESTHEVEAAFRVFLKEHPEYRNDDCGFAYRMGWYDGRIALLDQRSAEEQAEIDKILKEMGVDNV